MRRFIVLALVLVALVGASTVAQAACRPESGLACNQVVNTSLTKVFQTGNNRFAIQLVFGSGVQFVCNGVGGNLPLPPGCTKDGVQYKPDISSNVATGFNNPQLCSIIEGSTTRSGATNVGFRVRFEQKNAPKRKTCIIRFDMPSSFGGTTRSLPFTIVNSPTVAPEE